MFGVAFIDYSLEVIGKAIQPVAALTFGVFILFSKGCKIWGEYFIRKVFNRKQIRIKVNFFRYLSIKILIKRNHTF